MNTVLDRRVVDMLTQAVALHQAGRLGEARQLYEQILRLHPNQADALHLLGVLAHQRGDSKRAVELIEQAIAIAADRWAFYSNLACALQEVGRAAEAIESYQKAIELGGESAALLSNLGTAHQDTGNAREAERCYRRAIELEVTHAEAHYNLGNILREAGRSDLAMGCYETALRHKPNYPEAHVNVANLLQQRGQYEEAERSYRWALEINPRDSEAHYNLARALQSLGRRTEAMLEFDRAIEAKPDHAAAHTLRAGLLLGREQWAEGWVEYEWRWQWQGGMPRDLPQPLWSGQPLAGKTILVHSERAIEDEILFGSCVSELIEQAGHCVLECDVRLVPVYRRSFPQATVQPRLGCNDHSWLAQMRPVDYQVPIGNLARYFRSSSESFPQRDRFLKADSALVARWKARFAELGRGPKIGISWRGGIENQALAGLMPLADWGQVLTLPGVHFINLQSGTVADEIAALEKRHGIEIHDWEDADPRRDFDSLAAQMAALDAVITVGNALAHLAGAIGAKVWTLLPRSTDWRWLEDRGDSPWYRTMRVVRQPRTGGWRALQNRVRELVIALRDSGHEAGATRELGARIDGPANTEQDPHEKSLKKRRISITDARWELDEASIEQALARSAHYEKKGEPHHAEGILREILRHVPKHATALHQLGCLLKTGGRREESIPYLREAANIAAARSVFHFDLAVALTETQQNQEAERELWRVIELDPNQGPAYVNLGVVYERLGKLDEALTICQRAIRLMPNSPQAHYNLANSYLHQGCIREALTHYERLIELDPKFYKGHWNRGLAHLLLGEFTPGWDGYRYRQLADQVQLNQFSLPEWDGGSLAGKTLLVHAEQGVGDEIMFNTCLPEVIRAAKHVHLTCDPRLERLFGRSFPEVTTHSVVRGPAFKWTPPPDIDVYTHAATLACYLRPDWDSFPRQKRLLTPDPAAVAMWRARYAELGPGPKIGMSWRAGGLSSEQRRRTSPLDHWQALFRLPGCHFINLQYGDWSEDLAAAQARWGVKIHDWADADPLSDLDGFAAQVAALDAVVSVGNTTIHMAGAVGVPTWAVLPRVPGWRYLLNADWLPWYATVRLRRQTIAGAWQDVYERVADEVAELLNVNESIKMDSMERGQRELAAEKIKLEAVETTPAATPATPSGTLPESKVPEAFLEALKQHRAGRLTEAEQVYRQILQIDPEHYDALHLLGVVAHQTGRLGLALESIERAIKLGPASSIYHYNFANTLRDAGRVPEAIAQLRRAVEVNPHMAEAYLNLGTLLQASGNANEAIAAYERALAVRPDFAEAHNNIGSVLRDLGRYEAAVECYRRAVEIRPQYGDAYLHLAGVLRELGRQEEALAAFDRGLELRPDNAEAHLNRAMLRIQRQDFAQGWREWEWRWSVAAGPQRRPFAQPTWDGSSLTGKTILVHMEQGVGDEIMFASCLGDVVRRAGKTVIECERRLVPVLARSFPRAIVRARESWNSARWLQEMPAIDYQIAAGSLPRLLRSTLADFPREPRYLMADEKRVEHWRGELAKNGQGLKVGISWRGGFDNFEGRQRSTVLEQWRPLAQVEGVQCVQLQYGDCRDELASALSNWTRPLQVPGFDLREDLDELAALIASLDLVISVGNVTAHLAGAIGTPTWVLLPRSPSWCWFDGLNEAYWYRSVELIRQGADGHWEPVFEAAKARLTRLVAQRPRTMARAPHFRLPTSSQHPDGLCSS